MKWFPILLAYRVVRLKVTVRIGDQQIEGQHSSCYFEILQAWVYAFSGFLLHCGALTRIKSCKFRDPSSQSNQF